MLYWPSWGSQELTYHARGLVSLDLQISATNGTRRPELSLGPPRVDSVMQSTRLRSLRVIRCVHDEIVIASRCTAVRFEEHEAARCGHRSWALAGRVLGGRRNVGGQVQERRRLALEH